MPSKRIRKIFDLRKREIPKRLYRELFMSFVYITLWLLFIIFSV